MTYQWLQGLRSFLYPPTCVLCESLGSRDLDLCLPCAESLPCSENACARCALPMTTPDAALCGACQRKTPIFDAAFAAYQYRAPVDYLIQQLKFHGKLAHARLLGVLFAEHVLSTSRALPDCIVPVPLHPKRLHGRGFNQSLELARHIGRRLRVPVDHRSARRIRHTDPQMELPAKVRRKNVRRAFEVVGDFDARNVAILDDVVTTGATVDDLARALKKMGAQRVDVWTIARVG